MKKFLKLAATVLVIVSALSASAQSRKVDVWDFGGVEEKDAANHISVADIDNLEAIAADGKLSEEEYNLMLPFLQVFLGDSIEYSVAKSKFKQLKKENKELKYVVNQMIDIIGLFSDDLKQDIIIICMMICAMDGKISLKEKKWIMQLMV